jgi:hypothetical protein
LSGGRDGFADSKDLALQPRHFEASIGGFLMARQLVVAVLLGGLVGFVPLTASAQIARTGPAALAQRMPTIYGPYLANMSRVRILHARGGLNPASYTGINRHKGQVPAGRQPSPRSSTAEPPSANLDTTFQVVRPAFVPQQLAARLGKTPQERREIEAVLTKCLRFYTDNARQKGVPLNDVARALNYFISTNYYVYSLGSGPTQNEMDATRAVIRANMAQDPTFRRMSDRQKQEAYETLIVLAGFVDLGFGTARQSGNESAAASFREMAKHNLETLLGTPVEKIHFTSEGLALN